MIALGKSTSRRRWRRSVLANAAASLIAAVAQRIGANPAPAVNRSLTTTDGIGIRIDENAILGPALDLIEDEMQPYVNQKIYEGALAKSVMDDPDWVQGSANLELSFDFVNAGVSGYPQGGLKVHAGLQNIVMRFYRYGEWWQPECQFRVNPDNGYIDASAKVNTALLPNAPLRLNPITAYWDNDPSITREKGNWLCNGYLINEWRDGLRGSGTTVAAQLETEVNGEAQDLINDLWTDDVTPIINSLTSFGITFNQVRTDDHVLIVTANTNATGDLTIPGLDGPYSVTNTPDAGVTGNVNTVLAARSEVTDTIHPNVVNQFLNLLGYGTSTYVWTGIEPVRPGATSSTYCAEVGSEGVPLAVTGNDARCPTALRGASQDHGGSEGRSPGIARGIKEVGYACSHTS